MAALARPTRIVRGKEAECARDIDAALFDSPQEADLWAALQRVRGSLEPGMPVAEWLVAVRPVLMTVRCSALVFFT